MRKILSAFGVPLFALFLSVIPTTIWAVDQIPPLKSIAQAKDFSLTDLDGDTLSLSQYRGKVVAINLWATWCPPCREELPSMQRNFNRLKDRGFVILAVNVGEELDAVAPFVEKMGLTFPVLLDEQAEVAQSYRALGLPTTFFVNRQGLVTHRIQGGRDWDNAEFKTALDAMVNKP